MYCPHTGYVQVPLLLVYFIINLQPPITYLHNVSLIIVVLYVFSSMVNLLVKDLKIAICEIIHYLKSLIRHALI